MKEFSKTFISITILLGMLFIPFTWNLFPFQGEITKFLFSGIIEQFFKWTNINWLLMDFSSDSKSLYALLGLILTLSFILTLILQNLNCAFRQKVFHFIKTVAVFYLAVILLKYGFDKLFKTQFHLPEPNILFTPLGKLDPDILFWSTMGASYSYNIFMGLAEIIPGILILFNRTRNLGLILSFGVLMNVFAINLSFDISVKLFSGFLLLINGFLMVPTIQDLWQVLALKKQTLSLDREQRIEFQKFNPYLKAVVLLVIFIESLFPYARSANFQDDLALRPYLHGAYEIECIVNDRDTLSNSELPYKRFFIHRDGYLIFQDQKDGMIDFNLEIDQQNQKISLTDYNEKRIQIYFNYSQDSLLSLHYFEDSKQITIDAHELNWHNLPLLQKQFHWTVD